MMKKNETLKRDIHRIYFWLFCLFLVIFLTYFSSTQFVQGNNCNGCESPSKCCSDECVDVQTDENNCGDCGTVCANSKTCCGGNCVDTKTDSNNCGDCGKVCEDDTKTRCFGNTFIKTETERQCVGGRCETTVTTTVKVCEEGETCDEENGCTSQEPSTQGTDTTPQTFTIDIARFVRTTVSFAELGSMAGTWLDKTFGTSFFSTPLWGELEKTWPLGAKIFGGNWESSICRDLWCIIPDDTGISTVGSAIGSHIEGQKLKIGDELNLYKITFALNPATESLTGQMNFTIELYDQSGNKEYIDVNNDKKPDTWININNKYATSKTNPIAFYSEKDYQKVCLKFFNTKDYIDELRLLLLSNSNQICSNFFEGDPSGAISEIQTGEIQVGGEVDECANC